jgi:hypothetical protein
MRLVTKWTIHPFISNSRITSLMCILEEKKKNHISPDVVAIAFKLSRVCNSEYPFSPKLITNDDKIISHFYNKPMA